MPLPTPPWQRTTKPRSSSKAPLSRDAIITAALKILDRDGLRSMSMRAVAQELGTGPASLYAHVANLADLEALVYDRVVAEIPLPEPDPARWREQLKELLFESLRTLRRHPGVARLGFGRVPTLENAMRAAEAMLGIMHAGGIPDQYAAWSVDMLGLFVSGAAYEEYAQLEQGQTGEDMRAWFDQFGAYMASLPADRFPNLVRMAPVMVQGGGDERLEFALDIMISGLAATAQSPR